MTRRAWLELGISVAARAQHSAPRAVALHLDSEQDRDAFRRWFTFLGEIVFFMPERSRPAEIGDCSALLRFAYREALCKHDTQWAARWQLPLVPALPSVEQYSYPHTPTGANVFRIGPDRFGEFANAEMLARWNAYKIGRDVARAEPADLLFYYRPGRTAAFHSMIFVGYSQVQPGPEAYVVYDTGSDGTIKGEIRRRSLDELLHYPDTQWQPRPVNPFFLGVYRWNILRGA